MYVCIIFADEKESMSYAPPLPTLPLALYLRYVLYTYKADKVEHIW
jgi:hypothetical protein